MHELAAHLHGHTEFDTAPGRGTAVSVYLRLPFIAEDTDTGPADLLSLRLARREAPPLLLQVPAAQRKRVLVCEDNPLAEMVLAETLRALGHDCEVAADGANGLAQIAQARFDVVLSDIEMPGMNGDQFLAQLRQFEVAHQRQPVAVVAVTAHASADDRERFLAIGFDGYSAKPFVIEDVRQLLSEMTPS